MSEPLNPALDAERAVLGALTLAPERVADAAALRERHFLDRRNGILLRVLRDMTAKGLKVDYITMAEALTAQALGGVVTADYLAELSMSVTSAEHLRAHVDIVLVAAHDRRVRETAAKLAGATLPAERADAERDLASLLACGPKANVAPLGSIRAADVQERAIEWLVPDLVPRSALSVLAGPGGLGKSTVAATLAAAVTTGSEFLGHAVPRGSVVFIAGEEDLGAVLRPKLRAAGADLERVHFVGEAPRLPREAEKLRELVRRIGDVRLVVVDTLADVADSGTDENSNVGTRAVLGPLRAIAEEFGLAVVGVAHMRKSAAGTLAARVLGSVATVNYSRSVLAVVKDPENPARRVLAVAKSNFAMVTDERHVFSLGGDPLRLRCHGTATYSESALLQTLDGGPAERPRDRAREFLAEVLADGPVPTEEVERLAEEAGIAHGTLKRAREQAGVRPRKAGFGGGWVLELPGVAAHPPSRESFCTPSVKAPENRRGARSAEVLSFEGAHSSPHAGSEPLRGVTDDCGRDPCTAVGGDSAPGPCSCGGAWEPHGRAWRCTSCSALAPVAASAERCPDPGCGGELVQAGPVQRCRSCHRTPARAIEAWHEAIP